MKSTKQSFQLELLNISPYFSVTKLSSKDAPFFQLVKGITGKYEHPPREQLPKQLKTELMEKAEQKIAR